MWPIAIITTDDDPRYKFSIFGDKPKERQESVESDSDPPPYRDLCSNKGLADVCCVSGVVTVILGALSAISGIFPKNQVGK